MVKDVSGRVTESSGPSSSRETAVRQFLITRCDRSASVLSWRNSSPRVRARSLARVWAVLEPPETRLSGSFKFRGGEGVVSRVEADADGVRSVRDASTCPLGTGLSASAKSFIWGELRSRPVIHGRIGSGRTRAGETAGDPGLARRTRADSIEAGHSGPAIPKRSRREISSGVQTPIRRRGE
jgi:hypothetical protein